MSIYLVMLSNHHTLCCPLLLLPSVFRSIRVFSSELALHIRWPEYWSFSFSISASVNIQGWFSLGLTGLIFLQFNGLSSSPALQFESINFSVLRLLYSSVTQSWLTLCDPMDRSPPGFSVHGIFKVRILEWGAISFSRGFSQPRD